MSHTHFFFLVNMKMYAQTHYKHIKSVLMVHTVDQGKPTRLCNNDSAWRQNLLLYSCFHQARLERWVVSDGWYREWERESVTGQETGLSLSLSLWLAHTHHNTAPPSYFLWLKPWQMGCSKLEGRTVLIRSLPFLSPIKILIFSLGSSRWSGASVFCWDDEGFGKTAKRSMSTWSHSEVPHSILTCLCSENKRRNSGMKKWMIVL